jgi:hypothetical protein
VFTEFAWQTSAQQEVQRLSQRVQALESELSKARDKAQTSTQPASSSDASTMLAANGEEPGEIKDEAVVPEANATEAGAEPKIALDELQAQFDKYKSEQSTKYEQGVMKVNSANVSFTRTEPADRRLNMSLFPSRSSSSRKINNGEVFDNTSRRCRKNSRLRPKAETLISIQPSTRLSKF